MHHTCIKIRRETALGKKERKKERKKREREKKRKRKKEFLAIKSGHLFDM